MLSSPDLRALLKAGSTVRALLLVVLGTVLVTAQQPTPAAVASRGCGKPLRLPVHAATQMVLPLNDPLLIDPYREYFAYLPKGFDNTRPLPVVYSFHGYYSSAERKMQQDKFVEKIEKHLVPNGKSGFVVIYGQGMNDCGTPHCYDEPYNQRSWNVFGNSESPGPQGHTCDQNRNRFGSYGCYTSCRMRANTTNASGCEAGGQDHCHASTCANDTLYAETLFNTIEDSLCIDLRRQYVTGMSVGGMMAYWVATHFTERFAAAIPVAGNLYGHGMMHYYHIRYIIMGLLQPSLSQATFYEPIL